MAIFLAFFHGIRASRLTPKTLNYFLLLFLLPMAQENFIAFSFTMPSIAHLCQSKLDDSNYLGWVFQFESIQKSKGLMDGYC
jgi:hypothetical protein